MSIRVRFAPSPTGELHVGGARTSIFNWLFARHNDGKFLLRIEDTDRQRSSETMTKRILEGLNWLGIDWDEPPVFQSGRVDQYKKNAKILLANGHAYCCFCSPSKLEEEKKEALRSGRKRWKYPGYCRNLSEDEVEKKSKAGNPYAVRFKVREGVAEFDDLVHGPTLFENQNIEDFVLLRSDGSPTYHLSVVSDDIAMGITHVIRGDDHISNTPKQILLYEALSAVVPEFAHIPLILGVDKKRLSKRHGATSLIEFQDRGYLPEAMFNFLSLLGWSPGDDREHLSRKELINLFSLSGVGKGGAVFDEKKLQWLNGQYINASTFEELLPDIENTLSKEGLWDTNLIGERKEWFARLIALLKPRCRMIGDFGKDAKPYLCDDFEYDEQGIKKHLRRDRLTEDMVRLRETYSSLEIFEAENLEKVLRGLAEEIGIAAAKLIHPLRMALVGVPVSPGVFEVAEIMGKSKTIERLGRLIEWLNVEK